MSDTNNINTLYLSFFDGEKEKIKKDFTIFAQQEVMLMGETFIIRIIGESHFISCEALGYHEVFSSVSGYAHKSVVFDCAVHAQHTLSFDAGEYTAVVEVEVVALESEGTRACVPTLKYTFSNGAYTSITLTESGYTTVHQYPEHDTVVHTKTVFNKKQ